MKVLCTTSCFAFPQQMYEKGKQYDYDGPPNRHLQPVEEADLKNWDPPIDPKLRPRKAKVPAEAAALAAENAELKQRIIALEVQLRGGKAKPAAAAEPAPAAPKKAKPAKAKPAKKRGR